MNFEYICAQIEKDILEDDFNEGDVGEPKQIFCRDCEIKADSLNELVKKLTTEIRVDKIDNLRPVFLGLNPDFNDERIKIVCFYRTETKDGKDPTSEQFAMWRQGKLKLFTARYHFTLRKVIKQPFVTRSELELLKIYEA